MNQLLAKKWSPSSFLPLLLIIVLLVLILAISGFRVFLSKKSAAEAMRRLKEVDDERLKAIYEARMGVNEESRKQAEKRLEELDAQLSKIAGQLSERRMAHQKYVQSLRHVTDWDDVILVK
jgi:uncharacterized protein HemX